MTPGAHLLASWILAENSVSTSRERRIVSIAGIIPDIDGLGVVADLLTHGKTEYFANYHHIICHNLLFGLILSSLSAMLVKGHRLRMFLVTLCAFHLHLLCDLIGSKGPDGYQWPLPYLYPFAPNAELTWSGQWNLNGWQNNVILGILFAVAIYYAARRRRSFVEVISLRLDGQIFSAISKRWPGASRQHDGPNS